MLAADTTPEESETTIEFDWGNMIASGFFFAMGSAAFASIIYLGRKAYDKSKSDTDDDE